ncbi:MAG TPA: hypothetical protein VN456_14810 [Desulfosporosinus sp.]|nr:hypothetical protein [Desulfosporosinus sp.]
MKAVIIKEILDCLKLLAPEEQKLVELFFKGKSEHQLAKTTDMPRMTIHNRKPDKNRILAKKC